MPVVGLHSLIGFFFFKFDFFLISQQSPSVSFSQSQLPKPTTLCGLVSMRGGGLPAARTRNSFNGAKLRFLSKGEKENPPLENLWTHSTVLCAKRSQAEGVQYMNQLHSVCPLRLQILQAKRGWNSQWRISKSLKWFWTERRIKSSLGLPATTSAFWLPSVPLLIRRKEKQSLDSRMMSFDLS